MNQDVGPLGLGLRAKAAKRQGLYTLKGSLFCGGFVRVLAYCSNVYYRIY